MGFGRFGGVIPPKRKIEKVFALAAELETVVSFLVLVNQLLKKMNKITKDKTLHYSCKRSH